MARPDEVTVKLDKGAHSRLQFTLAVDPKSRGTTVKAMMSHVVDRFVARRLRKLGIGAEQLAKAGVPVGALAEAVGAED